MLCFINFNFRFWWFWKFTVKFWSRLDWFKILKLWNSQWWMLKKSISQLPSAESSSFLLAKFVGCQYSLCLWWLVFEKTSTDCHFCLKGWRLSAVYLYTMSMNTKCKQIHNIYYSHLKQQLSSNQGILKGEVSLQLISCLTGLDHCFANKNKNCQLSYSWFRTSQTGGQQYSDTSPL